MPPIPGLDQVEVLTSDNVWQLRQRPERLVVLGGGPIGSELTQTFARLGSRVTQVEMAPRLLMREDPEVSALVAARFRAEGIARACWTTRPSAWKWSPARSSSSPRTRARSCAFPSMPCWWPWAAWPT